MFRVMVAGATKALTSIDTMQDFNFLSIDVSHPGNQSESTSTPARLNPYRTLVGNPLAEFSSPRRGIPIIDTGGDGKT